MFQAILSLDLLPCLFGFFINSEDLWLSLYYVQNLICVNAIAREATEIGTTDSRVRRALAANCTWSFASKDNLAVLVVLKCPT